MAWECEHGAWGKAAGRLRVSESWEHGTVYATRSILWGPQPPCQVLRPGLLALLEAAKLTHLHTLMFHK